MWFHSIDLGGGAVTTGIKSTDQLAAEVAALNVPVNLSGKSVLDIGAWDGFFSFEAERRGAQRVVALDHYAWSINWSAWHDYFVETTQQGKVPLPPDEVATVWDPERLPGRTGFDYARARLGSAVEPDVRSLGTFDVVFFLGVLYHLEDPFAALRRLREITRGFAVIETAGTVLPGLTSEKLWMFVESTELNTDPSNWWVPTSAGLTAACRAAGFRETRVILEPPENSAPTNDSKLHYGRITVHAYA
jgi:tRNA (mo5U34)-methyltransferase